MAALQREMRLLIHGWPSSRKDFAERSFEFFEKDGVAVVCAGIGPEAARRAAEAIITVYRPEVVVSAGFAGALDPALDVGHTLMPRYIIDAKDGSRTDCGFGEGVLISFADVANVEQKAKLWQAYAAQAVDMEAAAVARSAQAHGTRFLACKVISDTSTSSLPPVLSFVDNDGRFHAIRFIAYIAVRPWLWRKVYRLASDSGVASHKLCSVLTENLGSFLEDRNLRVLNA